jgi:hypothetical protein
MTRRDRSKSVESLTRAFVDRLLEAVERAIDGRTRALSAEWIDHALARAAVSQGAVPPGLPRPPTATTSSDASTPDDTAAIAATKRSQATAVGRTKRLEARVKASRTAAGAPPMASLSSPQEERRHAEFVRLRALLKPTGQDASATAATLPIPAPSVAPLSDPLRLLEDEVRAQVHALGQLPSSACTAQIAVWAGRVRWYAETHGNRVAADLLLDKIRALARAMDAGRIEALNGSWRISDWPSYIRANEALAEAPQDAQQPLAESLPAPNGEADYGDIWSQPS